MPTAAEQAASTASPEPPIDPYAPETVESPFAFYDWLRREAPIFELARAGYRVVAPYALVRETALAVEDYSSNIVAVLTAHADSLPTLLDLTGMNPIVDVLATVDPPRHGAQRRLANQAFSAERVAALEADVRARAERLVDAASASAATDWLPALAVALPMGTIVKLLGLPADDLERLRAWSDATVATVNGLLDADGFAAAAMQAIELADYLRAHCAAARRADRADLVGELGRMVGDGPEQLSEDEVLSIVFQLFVAGNDSTASLIASALRLMVEDAALQTELRARPERIPAFVEETLRLESPFQGHFRVARRDTVLGGQAIAAGTRLMLLWAAANRDASVFPNPDAVDLDRPNLRNHLAFGVGIHHCIGATLARRQAQIALEVALARTAWLESAWSAPPSHVPSFFVRRLTSLPVTARARPVPRCAPAGPPVVAARTGRALVRRA